MVVKLVIVGLLMCCKEVYFLEKVGKEYINIWRENISEIGLMLDKLIIMFFKNFKILKMNKKDFMVFGVVE